MSETENNDNPTINENNDVIEQETSTNDDEVILSQKSETKQTEYKNGPTTYSNIDKTVKSLLTEYKEGKINDKELSISLERMYKNEFTSIGSKRVYARYGITKTGKILIDFKKNGRPISLSLSECEKINNILSSRNFENYINSKRDLIEKRNKDFFDNLKKENKTNSIENRMNADV